MVGELSPRGSSRYLGKLLDKMNAENKFSKNVLHKILVVILWGLTSLLAGYEIFLVRSIVEQIYFRILVRYSETINMTDRLSATGIGNIASLFMAILAIVIVVGGIDYHWSNAGESRSYKWFAITLAFQLAVFALYIILN